MVATEHLVSRMNQRGIPGKLLNLVIEFGEQKQDKIILDRKLTLKIIQEIDQMRKDLIKIVNKLEQKLLTFNFLPLTSQLKVAVMGCIVNGPGEAKDANIGIAGGKGFGLLFKKGKVIKKIPQNKWVVEIIKEIKNSQYKSVLESV